MITTISPLPHSYRFFFLVRIFKIFSLSNFQVCNTVLLTIVVMLYIPLPLQPPVCFLFLWACFWFWGFFWIPHISEKWCGILIIPWKKAPSIAFNMVIDGLKSDVSLSCVKCWQKEKKKSNDLFKNVFHTVLLRRNS